MLSYAYFQYQSMGYFGTQNATILKRTAILATLAITGFCTNGANAEIVTDSVPPQSAEPVSASPMYIEPTTISTGTTTSSGTARKRINARRAVAASGSLHTSNINSGVTMGMNEGSRENPDYYPGMPMGLGNDRVTPAGLGQYESLGLVSLILSGIGFMPLVIGLIIGYGLFLIAKKQHLPAPWLAFVPVLNVYTYVKAAGKNGFWVLLLLIGFILFVIPGLIMTVYLNSCISKRMGQDLGSTLLLTFIPFIGFPYVGHTGEFVSGNPGENFGPARANASDTNPIQPIQDKGAWDTSTSPIEFIPNTTPEVPTAGTTTIASSTTPTATIEVIWAAIPPAAPPAEPVKPVFLAGMTGTQDTPFK